MAYPEKAPAHSRLDERNHVEKPLLDQLAELKWEVLDLEMKQEPKQSFRKSFDEVVLEQVTREQVSSSLRTSGSLRPARSWAKSCCATCHHCSSVVWWAVTLICSCASASSRVLMAGLASSAARKEK